MIHWFIHHPSRLLLELLSFFSQILFSSLRHLIFFMCNALVDYGIFLFLSPLLELLELTNLNVMYNEHTIVGPFLANLSSQILRRIVLRNEEIFKKNYCPLKQLRSLELSNAVFFSDFTAVAEWEVLGTLPSLTNLTLKAIDPALASHWHHAHVTENSNGQTQVF